MRLLCGGVLLVALILSGCSDGDVDIYKPDPLVDLDNQFSTRVVWETVIGDEATDKTAKLSPVYAFKKIYVASNDGRIAAVNPNSGKIIWRTELDTQIGGGPVVAGGVVAVGSQLGEVVVLDADNGHEKWRRPTSSEIIASPAIGDGHVVVRTVDGKITAFDLESGKQKWFFDQFMPSLTLRGNSAPVIAGGGVISGFSNGKLAVFILENGQLAWEKTITAPAGRSEIQRLVDVDIKPLVMGQSIYVAAYNGNLVSLAASSGEVRWQRELSTFQEMTTADFLLLVTHENSYVSAVNRLNGVILWTQKSLYRRQLSPSAAIGEHIVVADFEGYLHWLSKKDGTVLSRERIDSDGIGAMPLVVDDKVILLSHSGTLYAVKKQ